MGTRRRRPRAGLSASALGDTRRAMSHENVEIVRRLYERWATGDFTPDAFDPDVEFSRIGAQTPDMEGRWVGLDEFWKAVREYLQPLSDLRIEAERIIDLSGDRVLVLSRQTARGKQSGVPMETELARPVHTARRQDRPVRLLLEPRRSPRSRGAAGVAGQCRAPAPGEAVLAGPQLLVFGLQQPRGQFGPAAHAQLGGRQSAVLACSTRLHNANTRVPLSADAALKYTAASQSGQQRKGIGHLPGRLY